MGNFPETVIRDMKFIVFSVLVLYFGLLTIYLNNNNLWMRPFMLINRRVLPSMQLNASIEKSFFPL